MSPEPSEAADFRRRARDGREAATQREVPETREGAAPADSESPEFSRGQPLDDPQPSTRERPEPVADAEESAPPPQPSPGARSSSMRQRAYIEALLEGVPLPATRSDLTRYAKRQGDAVAEQRLKVLPKRRFDTIDEVGEALEAVQPAWPRERRIPRAESGLPPGGPAYALHTGTGRP